MRLATVGIAIALATPCYGSDDPPPAERDRIVQPITAQQFLKLPLNFQGLYIGGLIEGMAYAYYGDAQPDYLKFADCVRGQTLGDTTQEVVTFLQQQPDFNEGVSLALARTLGNRCKR